MTNFLNITFQKIIPFNFNVDSLFTLKIQVKFPFKSSSIPTIEVFATFHVTTGMT
jgi:hypothetical protein